MSYTRSVCIVLAFVVMSFGVCYAGNNWNVLGMGPDSRMDNVQAIMGHSCKGKINHDKRGGIDIQSCHLASKIWIDVWSTCGRLFAVHLTKVFETGEEAMSELLKTCPQQRVSSLSERYVDIMCKVGWVSIRFPEIGERISVVRHYSGNILDGCRR